ncbi:unnamed protein product [Caenorhabditis auriculariae]|uniref:Uncharacterized protein n=1 Tax=Caenorhabditis auriculariae TaxID=2777116 RepID=A0A8S1HIQ6_9PELO|nr:unnamed protein product [Caenorhabditis auriculariae]
MTPVCTWFNVTPQDVTVTIQNDGSTVWLKIYNLTTCPETVQGLNMTWSRDYCPSTTCDTYGPVLQWMIFVNGNTYSTITQRYSNSTCSAECETPNDHCPGALGTLLDGTEDDEYYCIKPPGFG